jgi:hypothetical protein
MYGYSGAGLREGFCNGGSQAGGGTSHKRDLLVETEKIKDISHASCHSNGGSREQANRSIVWYRAESGG